MFASFAYIKFLAKRTLSDRFQAKEHNNKLK